MRRPNHRFRARIHAGRLPPLAGDDVWGRQPPSAPPTAGACLRLSSTAGARLGRPPWLDVSPSRHGRGRSPPPLRPAEHRLETTREPAQAGEFIVCKDAPPVDGQDNIPTRVLLLRLRAADRLAARFAATQDVMRTLQPHREVPSKPDANLCPPTWYAACLVSEGMQDTLTQFRGPAPS